MKPPSARELLTDLWADADEVVRRHLSDRDKLHQAYQLAARVEKVLAEIEAWKDHPGAARQLAHKIERLLNGQTRDVKASPYQSASSRRRSS